MILELMLGATSSNKAIYDESSIVNIGLPLDLLESQLDQMGEMLDEQVLTETFLEEFSDNVHDLVIALTKGQQAMVKRAQDAAQQANNYKQEIETYLSSIDKNIRKTIYVLVETYTLVVSNGNTTITYTETRTPKFSGVIVDAAKYIKMINAGVDHKVIKKQVRQVVNTAMDQARFKVRVSIGKGRKVSADQAMKEISETIEANKKMISEWNAATTNMLKWIDQLKNMAGDVKQSNEEDIKFKVNILGKLIRAQKMYYNHDSDMVYTGSRMIVMKSRAIKDAIKKYAKVKL